MKAGAKIAQKGRMPDPLPNTNTGSAESRKRALSKDELIDLLERSLEKCVKSAESAIIDAIPVLLFLGQALNQDDVLEDILLHTKDGISNIATAPTGWRRSFIGWLPSSMKVGTKSMPLG